VSGWSNAGAEAGEPWFWPILELETGRVVGAELVRSIAPASAAAAAFVRGAPACEDWWLLLGPPSGAVLTPSAVAGLRTLLGNAALDAERLVIGVSAAELAQAVGNGAASAVTAMGVRLAVSVSLAGLDPDDPAHIAAVRAVSARATSVGCLVVGMDVESDAQVVVAGEAGLGLVQGYWWGSPGSLGKLVHTWARQPVTG
jgi:EAL domain-containing protein (putative c-di-GMP-specific phosphodiesterase class I)